MIRTSATEREPTGMIDQVLLCRAGGRLCALPIAHVVETMRPLPTESIAGMPSWMRGLAIIRGASVPVLALGELLGAAAIQPTRLVTITVGDRQIALMVDSVLGVRAVPAGSQMDLPMGGAEVVSSRGMLDTESLLVLRSVRLIPEPLSTGHGTEV